MYVHSYNKHTFCNAIKKGVYIIMYIHLYACISMYHMCVCIYSSITKSVVEGNLTSETAQSVQSIVKVSNYIRVYII